MSVKVGINGFGRIGRNIFRKALGDPDIEFVAVSDPTNTQTLAHLLKYESVLGNLDHQISATENAISVDRDEFKVFSQRATTLQWSSAHQIEELLQNDGENTVSRWRRYRPLYPDRRTYRRWQEWTLERNKILFFSELTIVSVSLTGAIIALTHYSGISRIAGIAAFLGIVRRVLKYLNQSG